ncbi:MAG TPA: trehalose-6-phosphate synthase, partial [Methylomirabilota bacterium]|nr:trehalose-6-phosphate synthase [Methylomirabilota bacterium]
MKFQLRLVAGLWLACLLVVGAFAYFQFLEDRQRLTGELDRRASLVSEGLKEVLEPALGPRVSKPQIDRLIKKFSKPDLGLAVYDRVASLIAATPDVTKQLENPPPEATWALTSGAVQTGFRKVGGTSRYVYADPILRDDKAAGALVIFLDASDLETAEWELWRFNAIRFIVLAVALAFIALLVVRMSLTQPLAKMARWTKAVRRGHAIDPPELPDESLFGPIAREVTVLAKNLQRARAAAEEEAALRLIGQTLWTEERLKQFAKMRLGERPLVVVSNREPVSHVWKEGQIQVVTPASGLVTAMDPVMRACGGVWVAQASGDADRETADARGRLRVPPDDPRFTLKRIWLTPEEEAGYYYGFSNEGLWPLCHIVHNRPLFRPEDWAQYRAVNEKFAAAVLEEIAGTESPMVLIQDYHFALLPSLIKRERPDARTAIFWHIPWPNFEAFSICPWQDELLLGMLGADLIGFHT